MAHALAAQAVRERGLDHWQIDSCGTGSWHIGKGADPRTMAVLGQHQVPHQHCARQLHLNDYTRFDWLLAMDEDNLETMRERAPADASARLALLVDWDPKGASHVPDPYYGGDDGFDHVYELVLRSINAFIDQQS